MSPFGSFADVMVERADGHRLLLAPDRQVADFVQATYTFDEVRLVPVQVRVDPPVWRVSAGPLDAHLHRRGAPAAGRLLRAVPARGGLEPGLGVGGGPGRPRASCRGCGPAAAPVAAGASGTARGTCTGSPRCTAAGTAPTSASWPRSTRRRGSGSARHPVRPSLTRVVSTVELPA